MLVCGSLWQLSCTNQEKMIIREFTEKDTKQITDLMKQLCSIIGQEFDEERWKASLIAEFNADVKNEMIVAFDEANDKVAGMTLISIRKTNFGFLFGNVSNLIVDPSFRGEGIGEMMLRYAMVFFKKNHINSVRVIVKTQLDEIAQKLFAKFGFDEIFKVFELKI